MLSGKLNFGALDFTWLRDKGLKRPLPAKLANLSPGDKAALLSEEVLYIKHHQRSSGGLADLKAGKMTTEMFAQLLAAKSFSIGDGSWVYAAASLGAPSS